MRQWLCAFVLRPSAMTENTGFQMVRQQFHPQRIQGRTNGRNLGQDVHTIAIFFGHALNTGDLARNPVEPRIYPLVNFCIHETSEYTRLGYTSNLKDLLERFAT